MKTAGTSQKLADTLRAAGLEKLAQRAELNEFHDFFSPHDAPDLMLDMELVAVIKGDYPPSTKDEAIRIRSRHHNGEFDADQQESDEWAESPDGQTTFDRLIYGS
jgi:hypothetical protein